jgi:hypothetical protein
MRKFTGAFIVAGLMAGVLAIAQPASADQGGPGGPKRSTCAFLQGILYKVGNPAVVGAAFESIFGCDLNF